MFCHLHAKTFEKVIPMLHPFPKYQMRREAKSEGRKANTEGREAESERRPTPQLVKNIKMINHLIFL